MGRTPDAVLADIEQLIGRTDNVLGWRGADIMGDNYGTEQVALSNVVRFPLQWWPDRITIDATNPGIGEMPV